MNDIDPNLREKAYSLGYAFGFDESRLWYELKASVESVCIWAAEHEYTRVTDISLSILEYHSQELVNSYIAYQDFCLTYRTPPDSMIKNFVYNLVAALAYIFSKHEDIDDIEPLLDQSHNYVKREFVAGRERTLTALLDRLLN